MSMSRKQYEAIANAIATSQIHSGNTHRSDLTVQRWTVFRVAIAVAAVLEQDNPNFDRQKFLEACDAKQEALLLAGHGFDPFDPTTHARDDLGESKYD